MIIANYNFHISNHRFFEDLAIKTLNVGYKTNEKNTEAMITRDLSQFPNHTCLSLAKCSGQEKFISQSCVQQLLNDVWMGVIKTKDLPIFSLLSAVLFPPLIFRFDFRNKSELEKVVHVEDKKEHLESSETPKEHVEHKEEENESPDATSFKEKTESPNE